MNMLVKTNELGQFILITNEYVPSYNRYMAVYVNIASAKALNKILIVTLFLHKIYVVLILSQIVSLREF